MDIYTLQASDVLAVQAEQGAACPVFLWNGRNWQIMPGSAMMNQPLRAGGLSQIYDLAFSAVVSQFGNQPIATLVQQMLNTPIVYLGLKYKIEYVHILTGATIITVACNSLNQNA